jgi:hypothetical protein
VCAPLVLQYMDWASPRPVGEVSPTKDLRGDYTDDLFAGPQGADLKRRETVRHAQFFNNPNAKAMYKAHITYLTNRVNSINGWVWVGRLAGRGRAAGGWEGSCLHVDCRECCAATWRPTARGQWQRPAVCLQGPLLHAMQVDSISPGFCSSCQFHLM